VKLLRVLEGHVFERVGGSEPIRVDVRIIAATHRDLPALVEEDRFRSDLYYRLRVIELQVPPLRDRGNDAILLAEHFVQHFRRTLGRGPDRLSPEAKVAIMEYSWPGNVRELKNSIERAVILGSGSEIMPGDLALAGFRERGVQFGPALMSLAQAEQRYIRQVLEQVDGNKSKACKILAIGRGTLYKKLE
jgi:Nif-specific regulatory protein